MSRPGRWMIGLRAAGPSLRTQMGLHVGAPCFRSVTFNVTRDLTKNPVAEKAIDNGLFANEGVGAIAGWGGRGLR